jgi:glucosamine--fructose-6-phosphate aminotransferase (isomerizing)
MNLSHFKIEKTQLEEIYLSPKKGFEHFMLQEIMEQSETINRAMNFGGRFKISKKMTSIKLGGLEEHSDMLKSAKNVIIIACGTSYFASMFVCNLLRKLEIFNTIQIIDGAEFSVEYIPKENPLAIFVSQSGESFDILRAVNTFIKKSLK